MVKFCPYCGTNLEAGFKFCPECGKELPEIKKTGEIKPEKVKTSEPIKEEKPKPKKAKIKIKFPKLSFKKVSKKTAIIIVAIICIAAVISVAAHVVVNNPFAASVGPRGRTFTVTVNNDFESDAECYLTIDNLRQGIYGNPGFTVTASGTEIITIKEDDLIYQRENYTIKLIVTIDDVSDDATASAVTESAEFLIDNVEGQFYNFYVNCTSYQ